MHICISISSLYKHAQRSCYTPSFLFCARVSTCRCTQAYTYVMVVVECTDDPVHDLNPYSCRLNNLNKQTLVLSFPLETHRMI